MFVSALISAVSTAEEDSGSGGFIFIAVAIAIAVAISAVVFNRRNRKTVEEATGGAADSFAFVIAPAHPLAETLEQLRSLLGSVTPAPAITRYSRPVVTVDATGVTISDKRLGELASIPVADIARIDSRATTIKPHGLLYSRTFQAVFITARRGAETVEIGLPPVAGAYDSVTAAQAQAIAAEVARRIERGSAPVV